MTITIRPAEPGDEAAWRRLWRGYQKFYKIDLSDSVTTATWDRLLDDGQPMACLVAVDDANAVIGFTNYVIHGNTWTTDPVCYLEDLFVDQTQRAKGCGKALIDFLVKLAEAQGWHRVYWMTDKDNHTARALYDKLTPVTKWVRYDIATHRPPS